MGIFNWGAFAYDILTAQPLWRQQIASILDRVPDRPAKPRLLDLGCGPGVSTFVLAERLGPHAELVGVDLSAQMIERARRHHAEQFPRLTSVRFEQADATHLPFDDGRFDLAVGHSFLYLVDDRAGVLREVRRVLAPGGALVLMEPSSEGSLFTAARQARRPSSTPHTWDLTRFLTSMVLWRTVAALKGPLSPAEVDALFLGAGFRTVDTHPTLGGLGMHCVGRV